MSSAVGPLVWLGQLCNYSISQILHLQSERDNKKHLSHGIKGELTEIIHVKGLEQSLHMVFDKFCSTYHSFNKYLVPTKYEALCEGTPVNNADVIPTPITHSTGGDKQVNIFLKKGFDECPKRNHLGSIIENN